MSSSTFRSVSSSCARPSESPATQVRLYLTTCPRAVSSVLSQALQVQQLAAEQLGSSRVWPLALRVHRTRSWGPATYSWHEASLLSLQTSQQHAVLTCAPCAAGAEPHRALPAAVHVPAGGHGDPAEQPGPHRAGLHAAGLAEAGGAEPRLLPSLLHQVSTLGTCGMQTQLSISDACCYFRLKLKDQIMLFNHLLEQQVQIYHKIQHQGWTPPGMSALLRCHATAALASDSALCGCSARAAAGSAARCPSRQCCPTARYAPAGRCKWPGARAGLCRRCAQDASVARMHTARTRTFACTHAEVKLLTACFGRMLLDGCASDV